MTYELTSFRDLILENLHPEKQALAEEHEPALPDVVLRARDACIPIHKSRTTHESGSQTNSTAALLARARKHA